MGVCMCMGMHQQHRATGERILMLISFDFETFYDETCTLKKLSYTDYIHHHDFKVHGAGVVFEDGTAMWVDGADIQDFILAHRHDTFVFFNALFDASILCLVYGFMPRLCVDVMSMARIIDGYFLPELSLGAVSRFYGVGVKGDDLGLSKGVHNLEGELREKIAAYSINDAMLTFRLFRAISDKIKNTLGSRIYSREMNLINSSIQMIRPRLALNEHKITNEVLSENIRQQESLRHIAQMVGLPIAELEKQVRSRPKFAQLLERMGVNVPMKTSKRTGKQTHAFAKNDDGFIRLQEVYAGTEVGELIDLRKDLSSTIRVTRSQRFERMAQQMDGRLPVHIAYFGAQQTGRWGGANSANIQNLPRGSVLRESIEAPKGYKLVIADFSAIEARVLAWLADDQTTLQIFRDGGDVYVDMANSIWGDITGEDGNPDASRRFVGKVLILALGYYAGWTALEAVLRMGALGPPFVFSEELAKTIVPDTDDVKRKLRDMMENNREKFDGYAMLLKKNPALLWHFAASNALVDLYRRTHPEIKALWKQADPKRLLERSRGAIGDKIGFVTHDTHLELVLPDGMRIFYNDMQEAENNVKYTLKGETVYTYSGKVVENLTQSVARQCLAEAWVSCLAEGLQPVMSVHDELVFIARECDVPCTVDTVERIMSKTPAWAEGLPLEVKVKVGHNYLEK